MDTNQVTEHLQVIRTLMERSALYRRALAPIMTYAGSLGVLAAAAGIFARLDSTREFASLWFGTAFIAIAGAFAIARRQAFREKEEFWSSPTRRVAQALSAPLAVGFFIGLMCGATRESPHLLAIFWILFYGCALHAAGFFTPRGMRWFGWLFIVGGCLLALAHVVGGNDFNYNPHLFMGTFFGGLHLAYGIYLYFTEKKTSAP
jgi:hypothetical protein